MVLGQSDAVSDGLGMTFRCPQCEHEVVMETNSGETQLVQSLGVRIGPGHPSVPPLAGLRAHLSDVHPGALDEDPAFEPVWTPPAEERLAGHPLFLQPLIRKVNVDYARRRGLKEISPEVMDACKQAQPAP